MSPGVVVDVSLKVERQSPVTGMTVAELLASDSPVLPGSMGALGSFSGLELGLRQPRWFTALTNWTRPRLLFSGTYTFSREGQ